LPRRRSSAISVSIQTTDINRAAGTSPEALSQPGLLSPRVKTQTVAPSAADGTLPRRGPPRHLL
jgi:hypothetical protein